MSDHSHIAAIVSRLGLTVSSVFVPFSQSRNAKPDARPSDRSMNWKVTLKRADRDVLTTDYQAGIAHCPAYKIANLRTSDGATAIRLETETGKQSRSFGGGTPYSSSKSIDGPNVLDVLHSLVMDSDVIDHATFESWAGDFGYDTDSRSAEAIYRACLSHALALRSAIGEAGLSELREAFSDY